MTRLGAGCLTVLLTWGFWVTMEHGPTVRVGGLDTRDRCWRLHKILTEAHPEWTLGDCEVDK